MSNNFYFLSEVEKEVKIGSGGMPSMGSHRVGHDWNDLAAAAAV